MADPFEEYENYRQQYEAITASGPVLSEEDQALADARSRMQGEAYHRQRAAGPRRRVMAGARNIAGNVPIASHIPAVRNFANPDPESEEGRDLQDYRTGYPTHSRVGGFLGGAAPYAMAGAAAPALFSGPVRAGAVSGLIGGTDAAIGGENPIAPALANAAGSTAAWGLGKVISPNTPAVASRMHRHRDFVGDLHMRRINEAQADLQARLLSGITGRNPRTGRFTRRIDPANAAAVSRQAEARLQRDMDRIFNPRPQISPIRDNTMRNIENSALWGVLGAVGGSHPSINNPIAGGALGAVAPIALRRGRELANRGIRSINRKLMSPIGGKINTAIFDHMNRGLMSDRARAMLHAVGGASGDEAEEAYDNRIPRLGN